MRLSVNVEMLFTEAGPRLDDRVRAAASVGVDAVEFWNTAHLDIASFARALEESKVELVSLVAEPRATLVDVGTHDAYVRGIESSCRRAQELGCPNVVVGSGVGVPFLPRTVQHDIVVGALSRAAEVAQKHGIILLLENLNTRVDHPGILFDTADECAAAIRSVGSPHLRFLYDLYHALSMGEDPSSDLPEVGDLIGHVQVASVPGRHEPGSDRTDWAELLGALDNVGYSGRIGLEYHPTIQSAASIAQVRAALAGEPMSDFSPLEPSRGDAFTRTVEGGLR
jgi:hydroxypyruvate isomerase